MFQIAVKQRGGNKTILVFRPDDLHTILARAQTGKLDKAKEWADEFDFPGHARRTLKRARERAEQAHAESMKANAELAFWQDEVAKLDA